jgi:hypothetical protein
VLVFLFGNKRSQMSSPTNRWPLMRSSSYDHTDLNSATYNVSIDPFDSGMSEQWLNFHTKLRIIIRRGHGLDENGPACFNLTCALLKDDTPRLFDKRAIKLAANKDGYTENKTDHILCLHSISQNMYSCIRYFNHKNATCNTQSILNFTQGLSVNFALAGINLTTILSNSHLLVKTRSLRKMIWSNWCTTSCQDAGDCGKTWKSDASTIPHHKDNIYSLMMKCIINISCSVEQSKNVSFLPRNGKTFEHSQEHFWKHLLACSLP